MLKLDEKEYNLNNILGLNFDMLKEILLKLSLNQNNIHVEIKGVKDSNEERDKKISDLDNKIKELNDYIKNKEKEFNKQYILKEEISFKNHKEDYNKEKENEKIKIIENEENKEEDKINENKENKENKEEDKINENKENKKEKEKEKINENKENKKEKEKDNDKEKNNIINEYIEENNIKDEFHKDESINIEAKINIRENKFQENEIIPKIELNTINYNKQKTDREIINNNEIPNEENEDINPKKFTYYNEKDKDKERDIDSKKEKNPIYKTDKDIIDLNSAVLQKSQMSYDIIRNILHSISEINEKINFIEGNLNKKQEDFFEKKKDLLSEHIIESKSKFNSINKKHDIFSSKIRDLQDKFDSLEQKIIEMEQQLDNSKNKKPEIIQIFNDDKDSNEKMMSSTFKESLNKKFELNENRYMKAAGDNFKLNQKVVVLKGITDKLTRQYNLLKDDNKNIKDNLNLLKNETNELIDNKNNELKNDIKEEMNKNLNDINNIIDTKIRELLDLLSDNNNKNNNTNIKEFIKDNISEKNDYKADKALIKLLNKKVTEINEKIEAIEQDIKNQKKKNATKVKDLDDIKQCIVELYDNINSKIGKDDLKELYDFYLDHVNEIKYIRGKLVELNEVQEKFRENTPNFIKRLESLTHDISELQESDKKKVIMTSQKQVDLSNYITEKRLKNTLSPITEELEILISEKDYLNNMLNDISEKLKFFEKKEHVDHIEAEINEKINLLSNRFSKQYIERIEFHKIIKNIDIQIKLLQGNNHKKEEADNWILAKQPIKCFNCATCEANIANSSPPNEYLPWNKIPHGEKQYRIGQGFSKLLKKLNKTKEDNIKSKLLDNNSFENDNTNKYLLNSVNNINDIMKINNRIPFKEDKTPINIRKYKLPKVIESFRKKQKANDNIPITDDEKENEEVLIENEIENNSPKIVKITKVKNENEQFDMISNINNSRNKTGKSMEKKLNRIKSVPLY